MDIADITESNMIALQGKGYTTEDLSMLAESEVQALLIDDTKDNSAADPHEAAAAAQDEAAAAAAAAEGTTPPAAAAATEEEEAEPKPFVPQFKAEVPADAAKQISDLQTEEGAAFKRLMDGEIDADEYRAIKDRTASAIDELKTATLTATIFEQANKQTAEQQAQAEWKRAEAAAMNSFKAEGLDYRGKPALLAAYNTHLKALGNDPKNENRDGPWFLNEAHRLTKADLGITTPTKKVTTGAPTGVDLSELPPTLRAVPAAATGAVDADEFAHMRNLDGIALERAHAALTEAQRDRWMAQ